METGPLAALKRNVPHDWKLQVRSGGEDFSAIGEA
jgi:hypothetical protein